MLKRIEKTTLQMRERLIDSLSKPGKMPAKDGSMVSLPGFPPAMQTGDLMRSVFSKKVAQGKYHLGVQTPYAAFLEYGTVDMEARPFLRRIGKEWQKQLRLNLKGLGRARP